MKNGFCMRNIGLLLGKETAERRKLQKLKKVVREDTLGSMFTISSKVRLKCYLVELVEARFKINTGSRHVAHLAKGGCRCKMFASKTSSWKMDSLNIAL